MSYNITKQKINKIDNLKIDLLSLYKDEKYSDWIQKPTIIDFESKEVEIEGGCGQIIKGILDMDDVLEITSVFLEGEGSGSFMRYIFLPALEDSKGTLDINFIWEGGDSISNLLVVDGLISESEISI